jgi:peroxin-12
MQNMMEQMTRRRARRATRMEQVWQQGTVQNGGSLGYMRFLASSLMQTVADYGKYGVLLAICAFKFFEWYYSDANRLTQERKLPIPPAPPVLKAHPESAVEVKDHGKAGDCLLCHRPRTNEACASSGYVFCYPCIYGYVSEHGKCPVTLLNCKVAGIRKIYDADN